MSCPLRASCSKPRSIHDPPTPSTGRLAGTLQATPMLLSDVLWRDDIPLSHPYTSPVRLGCRTAGFGLIRGIPSSWLSCRDPSTRLMHTIRPAIIVSPHPIPSNPFVPCSSVWPDCPGCCMVSPARSVAPQALANARGRFRDQTIHSHRRPILRALHGVSSFHLSAHDQFAQGAV